jgi:DNA-directed RNA polymerase subunit beta'
MLRDEEMPASRDEYKLFSSEEEAHMAYENNYITLHEPIIICKQGVIDGKRIVRTVETTIGRVIFNEKIPQDLGFVDRSVEGQEFDYEVSETVGKSQLSKIIERCIKKHGFARTAEVLDNIKSLGYHYSTLGAITISVADMVIPEEKKTYIAQAEDQVLAIEKQFKRGFISAEERYRLILNEWEETTNKVSDALFHHFKDDNPIKIMSDSGARGSKAQIRQLAGMRGLISNTAGRTIEIPIKANYREGLTVLEYFTASRGARKGLADTALRTADSGYLTRRLVDVSQDVIIRMEDCGTHEGIEVYEIEDNGQIIEKFEDRLIGRYPAVDMVLPPEDVLDPETGEVKIAKGSLGSVSRERIMNENDAKAIVASGLTKFKIRSVLGCAARHGVCARCYGSNLATGEAMNLGEAVGIIAAQSIGEPGTQLTMRTFHTGGIASKDAKDITQGLPRVVEMFEARKPKHTATLAEISGTVFIEDAKKGSLKTVTIQGEEEVRSYQIPASAGILVKQGDVVEKGDRLTEGNLYPQDVLRIRGVEAVEAFLIQEVQKVYGQHALDIDDRHIEIIIRQMMRKVRIEDPGDTNLLLGSFVDRFELISANQKIRQRIANGETNLREAVYVPVLLGITRASLATESFLSAASFQETTRVLTDAAIKGKVDPLLGLKENVIIGKLIPAGTGMPDYQDQVEEDEASYHADFRHATGDYYSELDGDDSGLDEQGSEEADSIAY